MWSMAIVCVCLFSRVRSASRVHPVPHVCVRCRRFLSVDDVVRACKKTKDSEGFRFNICLARRWPRVGVQQAVQTLIMSPARQSVASRFTDPLRPGRGGIARPLPMQLGGVHAPATPATLARTMHSRASSGGSPKQRRTSEAGVSQAAIDAVVKMLSNPAACVAVEDVYVARSTVAHAAWRVCVVLLTGAAVGGVRPCRCSVNNMRVALCDHGAGTR